jgi:hypothetical protein
MVAIDRLQKVSESHKPMYTVLHGLLCFLSVPPSTLEMFALLTELPAGKDIPDGPPGDIGAARDPRQAGATRGRQARAGVYGGARG